MAEVEATVHISLDENLFTAVIARLRDEGMAVVPRKNLPQPINGFTPYARGWDAAISLMEKAIEIADAGLTEEISQCADTPQADILRE